MKKYIIASLLFITGGVVASAQTVVAGADVGYLVDSEAEYLTARLGFEFKTSGPMSHQLGLEIGFTDDKESGVTADLLPVTANYRLAVAGAQRFGWYAGFGLGFARARIDGVSTNGPVRLSDNAFAAQGFAGITYQVGPSTALTLGARYIWIDDVNFAGTSFEVGDDLALSAGFNFRF